MPKTALLFIVILKLHISITEAIRESAKVLFNLGNSDSMTNVDKCFCESREKYKVITALTIML